MVNPGAQGEWKVIEERALPVGTSLAIEWRSKAPRGAVLQLGSTPGRRNSRLTREQHRVDARAAGPGDDRLILFARVPVRVATAGGWQYKRAPTSD